MLFLFEKPQIKIWIGAVLNIRKKNKMETLRTDWISIPFFIAFSSFNLIFLFRYTTISSQTCFHWWTQSKKLFQQSQNCIALSFMSSILFFEYIALQCEQCQRSFHYLIPLLDTAVIVPNQQKLHLRWLLQIHQVPYEFFNHLCLLLNNDEFVICDIFFH